MGKDILYTIVENKKLEVKRQKEAVPLDLMMSYGLKRMNTDTVSMRGSLEKSKTGIIAEFKRRSPSKGWLHKEARIEDVLPLYEKGGASACSILTDGDFFGGSFSDLQKARELVKLPLIRKDFIIDEYQLYQARIMGADAVLLIAAILTREECRRLAKTAHELELEVLLEIHSENEISHLNNDVDMLGVNNRNLGSFHTDVNNSFKLVEAMKKQAGRSQPLFCSESGLSGTAIIKELQGAGFKGFLMGEAFMKTDNPGKTLEEFITALCPDI
jgi:indole-3-glycerol phosphate synthase